MQNRREFLKRASLMLAGGIVMPQLLTSLPVKPQLPSPPSISGFSYIL